jgi:hypothetical protein
MNRKTLCVIVVAIAAGLWYSGTLDPTPPKPDRPVLRFLARLAKLGLWITVFADPPETGEHAVQYARTDAEGHRVLRNSEGW